MLHWGSKSPAGPKAQQIVGQAGRPLVPWEEEAAAGIRVFASETATRATAEWADAVPSARPGSRLAGRHARSTLAHSTRSIRRPGRCGRSRNADSQDGTSDGQNHPVRFAALSRDTGPRCRCCRSSIASRCVRDSAEHNTAGPRARRSQSFGTAHGIGSRQSTLGGSDQSAAHRPMTLICP